MIDTSSKKIILKIPVSYQNVRFNGVERRVVNFNQGFVDAEYEDGNVFPVSNPLKHWLIDLENQRSAGGPSDNVTVYFELVTGVFPASNPGFDDNPASLTYDEFSVSGVDV